MDHEIINESYRKVAAIIRELGTLTVAPSGDQTLEGARHERLCAVDNAVQAADELAEMLEILAGNFQRRN